MENMTVSIMMSQALIKIILLCDGKYDCKYNDVTSFNKNYIVV